ncbi:MAG: hypothetical protein P0Y49_01440 [Candidatus Pedobacter colombiensis]|uniref:Uncharacterized protein n=1 Tax=Candidatus Pedobacter colombiensis TaxID=3121371 RepID=A0AAJ6B7S7_9SPHI|nr:hypothetical protein [Pedobacter sp.]WEK19816.1 MAG: hypothetical protein P0Y49_01440 [Pedobacter sp.]
MKKLFFLMILFASNFVFAQKGNLYTNFPETFESPDTTAKSHYKKADVDLKSGNWIFDQSLLGAIGDRDRVNGKQSVRFQQNRDKSSFLEMNFDLLNGASKVQVAYGSYYKDPSCKWRLESSTDGGKTWKQEGKDIEDANNKLQVAIFNLDLKGRVRFRINKLGLGSSKDDPSIKNGRLNIDDFAVYQN